MTDAVYWIWLQQAVGAGAPQGAALLRHVGSVRAAYEAATYPASLQLTPRQQKALKNKDLSKAEKELSALNALGAFLITPQDDEYDTLFEGMYAPPVVIYGLGTRFDPCDTPRIAVVGTRRCDDSGILVTRRLAAGLAAGGATLVSGGAEGLDSEGLEAALEEGGRCISFQACGLDVDYPHAVRPLRERLLESGGMLLSEFALGSRAYAFHFPIRNRLIAASAHGTLVTEAPLKSGALMTAKWAREQGRDVFTAPGPVGVSCAAGSNELLKEGAVPVTAAADILMTYAVRYPLAIHIQAAVEAEERAAEAFERRRRGQRDIPSDIPKAPTSLRVAQPSEEGGTVVPCPVGASPDAKAVYASLAVTEQTPSELSKSTGLPLNRVLAALTMLELSAAACCTAGQRYQLRTER